MELEGMLVAHFETSHKFLLISSSPSCSGQEERTRRARQAGQAFLLPCATARLDCIKPSTDSKWRVGMPS